MEDRLNIARMIYNDEIKRPPYAFGVWLATLQAARLGINKLQVFEFGVAHGAGLLNLCDICEKITQSTDIEFEIYGFDSDVGMPKLHGYKDHPEIWHQGQFKSDHEKIRAKLPSNARLISGDIRDTIGEFCEARLSSGAPVGFVSVDVDLYSSTLSVFKLLEYAPENYLPVSILYFDDINDLLTNNQWCGEMLAINEFNQKSSLRKLEELRIRQNHPPAGWHDHIYGFHVFDHPIRAGAVSGVSLDINITAI